jgi:MOSC domain-containing protein YiiM
MAIVITGGDVRAGDTITLALPAGEQRRLHALHCANTDSDAGSNLVDAHAFAEAPSR